ncbi:MAG: cation:proton antiporter [Spartobacteria bacterium]|nr:cation:proton antiporter [Spartobacteria bacterium]
MMEMGSPTWPSTGRSRRCGLSSIAAVADKSVPGAGRAWFHCPAITAAVALRRSRSTISRMASGTFVGIPTARWNNATGDGTRPTASGLKCGSTGFGNIGQRYCMIPFFDYNARMNVLGNPFVLAALDHGFSMRDPIVVFGLAILAVLLSPWLVERLRLPGLVGLIVVGILLGPHALGWIPGDSLIPPLGSVGLLYLMFLAGVEVDMENFRRHRTLSLAFGLTTFGIPQVLGTLGAVYLLRFFGLGFGWAAGILLASMFASHTLVPYPVVQRLGLVRERCVTAAIGGTIITDVLALLVLAVVAEITRGVLDAGFVVRQTVLFIVYVGAVLAILPRLARLIMKRLARDGAALFLFTIGAVYACAALAPLAGLEPIIGAFLAGLTLNSLIPERSTLMTRLRFVGEALFIPFFLLSVGMRVNPAALLGGGAGWIVMAYMVIMVTLSKWLAAWLTARFVKLSDDETYVLFGLSVNQAAATLAAVMVGVQIGLFNEAVLNGTILMILATCTIGPLVTERAGRRLAIQRDEEPEAHHETIERLLVPIQHPTQVMPLMELALMARRPRSQEPVYPLAVMPNDEDDNAAIAFGERLLAPAVLRAVEAEIPVHPITRIAAEYAAGVLDAARDLRATSILLDDTVRQSSALSDPLEQIVKEGHHLILRWRRPGPLNTCRRMVVFLPPWIERMPGFTAAWDCVKRLRKQAGMNMLIMAEAQTLSALRAHKLFDKRDAHINVAQLGRWTRGVAAWRGLADRQDFPVLFMARAGRLAWTPLQDRLPALLARHSTGGHLLMVYPAEVKWESEAPSAASPTDRFTDLFPEQHVLVKTGEPDTEAVLRTLLERVFSPGPARETLLRDLIEIARDNPLPLDENTVLLHVHGAPPPAPLALLATSAGAGFAMPDAGTTPENLVVLLAGVGETPEAHLRRLSDIAILFRQPAFKAALKNAEEYQSLSPSALTNRDLRS